MATVVTPTKTIMRPYREQGTIDYARLDYDADEPVQKPDAMQQNLQLLEIFTLLSAHFTDFHRRPDIFLDANTILCYDPDDLNVRVSPDVYLAFGVDTHAIRERKLYLPWEAGKPPDWVLEIASSSTSREDVGRKRDIYARIGVPEYWRFDPRDGAYHGEKLAGDRLMAGGYEPIELTTAPDGILKGYSAILGLSLCWDDNWPRLYDPTTNTYLETWQQERVARRAERAARLDERAAREAAESRAASEQATREAAETRVAIEQAERLAEQAARRSAETRAAAERAKRRTAEAELEQLRAQFRRP